MRKWFLAIICLLEILALILGCSEKSKKTIFIRISQIKPRGLVDTKLLKHSIDILPLLKYPPTLDGDAVVEYQNAIKIHDINQLVVSQNKAKVIYNTEVPELNYLLKAAEYKSCNLYSFITTHALWTLQGMSWALLAKGDKYIQNHQTENGLKCYAAVLLLGERLQNASSETNFSYGSGLMISKRASDSLMNYYTSIGNKEKANIFQAYNKECEDILHQYYEKRDIAMQSQNFASHSFLSLYEYTGLNKPITIVTTKLDALIEMALFDESSSYRGLAIYWLGYDRFLTQDEIIGIPYNTQQRFYIEEILKYIQKNDKDSSVREAAEKALKMTAKEVKKSAIESYGVYRQTITVMSTLLSSTTHP